jgi:hypothetical protein
MARPRKLPTKVVRINIDVFLKQKQKAKKRGMSLPDYLSMRLSR